MSTLSVGTIRSNTSAPPVIQNTNGTEIGTLCRAWVNFNGTVNVTPATTPPTNVIRASFNVSSITDNGTGDYTVNFTTAMPDADYAVSLTAPAYQSSNTTVCAFVYNGGGSGNGAATEKTTTALRVSARNVNTSSSAFDMTEMYVAIFR